LISDQVDLPLLPNTLPAPGEALVLSFKLPGHNSWTVVLAWVVCSVPIDFQGRHRVEARFGNLSGDAKDVIERFATS
jgi:hypothetical protein